MTPGTKRRDALTPSGGRGMIQLAGYDVRKVARRDLSTLTAKETVEAPATGASARPSLRDYIAVTKPKHQFVLLTSWISMRLAAAELSFGLVLATLIGTAFAVASSHVFNQLIDRDVDALMVRTRERPLAAGRLGVRAAVIYGAALGVISMVIMALFTNLLTVLLTVAGWFVYVVIYSYWLKRRTPWCTLIGGVSGAMPTLIGWAAVRGELGLIPFLLFALMTIWQEPHFFALALLRSDDYHRSQLPVVVVAYGKEGTLRQMLWYTPILVLISLLLYAAGAAGRLYLAVALVMGGIYLARVIIANRRGVEEAAASGKRLFHFSYFYLLAIFAMVGLDRIPT